MSGVGYADPIIQVVEKQVKDRGGILGGREVKFFKYDNRASVAEAQAGARKLVDDDGVVALTLGGVSAAEAEAVAAFAEEYGVLYTPFSPIKGIETMKFIVSAIPGREQCVARYLDFAIKIAKAKTIGFLAIDFADAHERVRMTKEGATAAGIEVVYEQYAAAETTDFSPYLTKLKYVNPDAVIMESSTAEFFMSVAKQITELGGFGNIKVCCLSTAEAAKAMPGADGWYTSTLWYPAMKTPGSVKFVTDYKAMHGREPSATGVYFYMSLWSAIYAIDLAGTDTDRVAIAQAARSGKLEWDTPLGHGQWGTDGKSNLSYILTRVENKQMVDVTIPQ